MTVLQQLSRGARFQSRHLVALAAVVFLTGCATTGHPSDPRDPFEPFNRGVTTFNDKLDKYALKPAAQGYRFITPGFARTGVSNFFSNLNDVTVTVNDLLQGKVVQGGRDALRFTLNTTIGLLGFVDVATHVGFEKHVEDFGQTLGVWGVGTGPYLVLPLFGPSTVRDTVGRLGDLPTSPFVRFQHVSAAHRDEALVVNVVSQRESLLDDEGLLDDAAVSKDHYNFIRDVWLQRRRNQVYDGHPPADPDDALDDDPAAAPAKAPVPVPKP